MVYERFIVVNGQKYGPYYYESYRDKNGNVVSRRLKNYKPEIKEVKEIHKNSRKKIRNVRKARKIFLGLIFGMILVLVFTGAGKIVGFVISEIADEKIVQSFDKQVDLEVKESVMFAGKKVSKNKNKRMDFDLPNGKGIRLYFDLLNYSEFIEEVISFEENLTEKEIEGIDLEKIKVKSDGLKKEELENILDEIVVDANDFDIVVESDNEKKEYKWGYKIRLDDLNFMAKIDVTAYNISIYDKHSLKVGNSLLSFEDLVNAGYSIRIENPTLKNEIGNLSELLGDKNNVVDESGYGQTGYGILGNVIWSITGYLINNVNNVKDLNYEDKISIFIERNFNNSEYEVGDIIYLDPFLIILISDAEHLDINREFVSDIYDEVKEKDGNWSEVIHNEEYVRVRFEKNLTKENDITIYARGVEEVGDIEVYRENGNEVVALFENISDESWYKIYLDGSSGLGLNENESYDVFDLKVIGEGIEFDYIVDPSANDSSNNVYQCGTIDSPGNYQMNQSIVNNSLADDCIIINAANVTLDCAGFSISSNSNESGIYSNKLNTTILNCNISMGTGNSGICTPNIPPGNKCPGGYGIELYRSNHSKISNSTLNSQNRGIDLFSLNNVTLENIIANYNIGRGISLSASGNNLTNITLLNNSVGIYVNGANNILINLGVNYNNYGVIFGYFSDNLVKDSNLSFNNISDVSSSSVSSSATNNTLLNCSYNFSKETVSYGQIVRRWYYQTYVNDSGGNFLSGANVSFYDKNNVSIGIIITNSSGWTNRTDLIEYVNNDGILNYYNNYTIYAYNESYVGNVDYNVSLEQNKLDNFIIVSNGTFVAPFSVVGCVSLNQANSIYNLTKNINQTINQNCITIDAQNITLDCKGYSIFSNFNKSGIYSTQINTTIKNCNISMGSGTGGVGIKLDGADNSFIENNFLDNQNIGFHSSSTTDNVSIKNSTFHNSEGYILGNTHNLTEVVSTNNNIGFYISGDNNTLRNSNLNNNTIGIKFDSSSNNVIIDSNFSLNINSDVYLIESSLNNTFINVSYNLSKEVVYLDVEQVVSKLSRKWYYQAHVVNASLSDIVNGSVLAYNASGDLVWNLTTNSSGWIPVDEVVEYVNEGGTRTYHNNYVMAATKNNLWDDHGYNVTLEQNNLSDGFVIDVDTTPPDLSSAQWTAEITSAEIIWTTEDGSNSSVTYWASPLTIVGDNKYLLSHSVSLTGLSIGTEYGYFYSSCDFAGNCNSSTNNTFTTSTTAGTTSGSSSGGDGGTSKLKDFSIDKDLIEVEITQGDIKIVTLKLTNTESSRQSFILSLENSLKNYVNLSETRFSLDSNKEKIINLTFKADLDLNPMEYLGNLKIRGENKERIVKISFKVNKKYYDFFVNKENINVELKKGDFYEENLAISNDENISQTFDLVLSSDLKEFVSLSEDSFNLESKSNKNITLFFKAKSDSKLGVYTGNLKIKNQDIERKIFIVLDVEESLNEDDVKNNLFDIVLDIDENSLEVAPGDDLVLNVSLINLGNSGLIRIPITYAIKNFNNNVLISEKENVNVDKELSFSKKIKLPFSFKEGEYVVLAEIEFGNSKTSSSKIFKVKKLEYVLLEFEYDDGELNLLNRTLEKGELSRLKHDLRKEYKAVLFSDIGEELYNTSFDDPSDLFSDAFEKKEIEGGIMSIGKAKFYLSVPESLKSDKVEVSREGVEITKEEVYDVGAKSCRLK